MQVSVQSQCSPSAGLSAVSVQVSTLSAGPSAGLSLNSQCSPSAGPAPLGLPAALQ